MIFAVDPSTVKVGWCVYDEDRDEVVRYGVHRVTGDTFDEKLADIVRSIRYQFEVFDGDVLAVEMPVLHSRIRNVKTVIRLAQVVGVLRYAGLCWASRTVEVLPSERCLAFGLAANTKRNHAKRMLVSLVNARFGLDLSPKEHDAADAIAVAVAADLKLRREAVLDAAS